MKKFSIHAIVFAVIFFLMPTNTVWALNPYQPETRVEILTEATVGDTPGSRPVFSRIIAGPVQKNDDVRSIDFFNAASGNLMGRLKFLPDGKLSWEGKGATAKRFQTNDLLIIPGLLIPMDVLPVNRFFNTKETAVYDFRREAGGRSFVDQIRLSVQSVSRAQARQAQWLRLEKEIPPELKLIKAVDLHTGQLIVKQLWAIGDDWWLYEQTPFRRSWRIK